MAWLFGKSHIQTEVEKAIDVIVNDVMDDENIIGSSALKNSDVYTAIRIIAGDIATTFIHSDDPAIEKLLNEYPNKLMTGYTVKHMLALNLLIYGNSYALIERDSNNNPIALKPVQTPYVSVFFDEYSYDLVYTTLWNNTDERIKKENILHFKVMSDDGLIGISPLIALKNEVALQNNGTNVLLSFFKRGTFGSGILKVLGGKLNKDAKKKIREAWEETNNGSKNGSATIILDETMQYTQLPLDTKVLELVNNNVYSTKQIAKVFGIPLNRFGMELVSSNDGEIDLQYVKSTLSTYFESMSEELKRKFGVACTFDASELLQTTFKDQTESMKTLVDAQIVDTDFAFRFLFGEKQTNEPRIKEKI